jgi:5-methylcytosine-specific restriction endonuclease McrA
MSWDNYGTYWQVDHIVPCSKFNLTDHSQVLKCFHFSNLQPLLSKRNKTKGASLIPTQTELLVSV